MHGLLLDKCKEALSTEAVAEDGILCFSQTTPPRPPRKRQREIEREREKGKEKSRDNQNLDAIR